MQEYAVIRGYIKLARSYEEGNKVGYVTRYPVGSTKTGWLRSPYSSSYSQSGQAELCSVQKPVSQAGKPADHGLFQG
jgi:hypothetical protein